MISINEQVNLLHTAYCEARGLEMRLDPGSERIWFDAHQCGVTPDDVKIVVKYRMKLNAVPGSGKWGLLIRNLVGDMDNLGVFNNQLAEAKAQLRKKVYTPAKAEALRSTHRPDEPEASPPRHVSEIFEVMRKQAN